MMKEIAKRSRVEFGDFQTPRTLADEVTRLLSKLGFDPDLIIEPTCGVGGFLCSAAKAFPTAQLFGLEINEAHAARARETLEPLYGERVTVAVGDFFAFDWDSLSSSFVRPLLLGNPPWVTNSVLSVIEGTNLPTKSNRNFVKGIDAITGKSNFDISEAILLRALKWLGGRGDIAVLCKTSVARKILLAAMGSGTVGSSSIYKIDAKLHFDVAVDACLFVLRLVETTRDVGCPVFESLEATDSVSELHEWKGRLLTRRLEEQTLDLLWRRDENYTWRSGIKHDAASIMELEIANDGLLLSDGRSFNLENDYLFPLLKSSDIANGRITPRSMMLVPQREVGQQTSGIRQVAPLTWAYLDGHRDRLASRGSSIYRGKAPFSVFGVGPYTFSPWKVAISALYKRLAFQKIGSYEERPIVFDDTVYFLACKSEHEASFLLDLLTSPTATNFFQAMIHWGDKRPITADVLQRLNLKNLAEMLGCLDAYHGFNSDERSLKQNELLFEPDASDSISVS